jgi:hypothetical protein
VAFGMKAGMAKNEEIFEMFANLLIFNISTYMSQALENYYHGLKRRAISSFKKKLDHFLVKSNFRLSFFKYLPSCKSYAIAVFTNRLCEKLRT